MTSFYQYSPLETLELQSRRSELDRWAWIPDRSINGQIKLEGGARFSTGNARPPPKFRLIQLKSGKASESVQIELNIYGLLDAPDYDALSYTWGNPEKSHQIFCNGLPMRVNENVHTALERLRFPDGPRNIWIDALCINQEDNDEKSNQVNLMGEIYARARSVPIWLGKEANSDNQSFQAIHAIHEQLYQLKKSGVKKQLTIGEINALDSFPNDGWKHISSLLSRPYFSRLWVLQEVVKARNAILWLGDQSLPFEQLGEVASSLPQESLIDQMGMKHVQALLIQSCRRMQQIGSKKLSLFDLLFTTNTLETSEPRDRIYSLLNLPLVDMEWVPLPNYNLSRMEVFRDFAILDLIHNKSLRAVSWASLGDPGEIPDSSFPSWAPDFSKKCLPVISFLSHGQKMRAGGELAFDGQVHGKRILATQGRKIGKIVHLGQSRKEHYTKASVPQPLTPANFGRSEEVVERQWIDEIHQMFARAFGNKYPSLEALLYSDLYKDLVRALCCNWDPVFQGPLNDAVVSELRLSIWHLKAMQGEAPIEGVWDEYELYRRRLAQGTTFRSRFCVLEDGKMGWVPGGAAVGDVIFIFNGAVVPFTLRSISDGTYLWVGESWISGVMNGEIFKSNVKPQRVRIR